MSTWDRDKSDIGKIKTSKRVSCRFDVRGCSASTPDGPKTIIVRFFDIATAFLPVIESFYKHRKHIIALTNKTIKPWEKKILFYHKWNLVDWTSSKFNWCQIVQVILIVNHLCRVHFQLFQLLWLGVNA